MVDRQVALLLFQLSHQSFGFLLDRLVLSEKTVLRLQLLVVLAPRLGGLCVSMSLDFIFNKFASCSVFFGRIFYRMLLLFNLGFQHSKLLGRVGLSNEGPEKVNLLDLPSALKISIFHPLKNGQDLVF